MTNPRTNCVICHRRSRRHIKLEIWRKKGQAWICETCAQAIRTALSPDRGTENPSS